MPNSRQINGPRLARAERLLYVQPLVDLGWVQDTSDFVKLLYLTGQITVKQLFVPAP